MFELVLASNNKHKALEIKKILKKAKVITLDELGFKGEIIENGETLKENSAIKARRIRKIVKDKIIIADDTGLEVEYLAKAPGIYSARFAGPKCNFRDNNLKLLSLLKGLKMTQRKAEFKTGIFIIFPDGTESYALGSVNGYISEVMKGTNGFGYDPVFFVPSKNKTYAQMTLREKNSVSHRKNAIEKAQIIIEKYLKTKSKK